MPKGKAFIDYSLPEEEFRYGRANRPPTPINYVVGKIYKSQEICTDYKVKFSWNSLINKENKM